MTREEAIEVYNGLINTKIKEAFEFFAPELRESEDERIRKVLLNLVSNDKANGYTQFYEEGGITCDDAIAYLEKQKEPHYTKRNALFEKCVANCDPEIMKKVSDEIDSRLKKEQKPAEWSKEDEKNRRNLMSLLVNMRGDRITEETYQKYYPWLKSLRSRPKPSDNWKPSEEQMNALYDVIHPCDPVDKEQLESLYEQLKKL